MPQPESTCWTLISAAAGGDAEGRGEFAVRYGPVVRAYLAARWRASPCLADLEDAVQEVFLECFKPGGVLDRADRGRGFRPFLYGVARNVALRAEAARARRPEQPPGEADLDAVADPQDSPARAFERAWAVALLREAAERMRQRAERAGGDACRRVELLRLRFHDGLPIREIATRWQVEAARLHHEYATARQEFKAALLHVVAFHHPGSAANIEQECSNLLAAWG
jgi:RNA polymerase sigma-70 factor (ECF subfamily)